MAFFTSNSPSVKKLKEVLQEQQEPFNLEVYLSERRYGKKRFSSQGTNSANNLLCLTSKKFSRANDRQEPSNGKGVARNEDDSDFIGRTRNRFSAADKFSSKSNVQEYSSSAEENSGSSSSASTSRASKLIDIKEHEVASDTKGQQECIKDNKKFSAMSELKEHPFKEDSLVLSRFHRTRPKDIPSVSSCTSPKNTTEDTIFSACLWELIKCTVIEKHNHVGVKELQEFISNSSQHIKIIRVLQQNKQLLFDCTKEATEIHGRKGKIWKPPQKILGPEELGKIICEHICSWVKQSGDVTNIIQLIHSDFYDFTEEWSNFQLISRKIGIEIGNDIMDEIILEMIDLYFQ